MDKFANCSVCGKLFETGNCRSVCHECIKQDMSDFDRIRDFLYNHPRAKVFEVSNNLDIPVPVIKRYLREGRLEIIEKNNRFLLCEKCGKPICSGTQCDDCHNQSPHDYKSFYNSNITQKKQTRISYAPLGK
ncbi:MAG: flagellar protein [Ruminiclostridium sp.]|nr:flagellar protein [Ruminiclostridium sp.]